MTNSEKEQYWRKYANQTAKYERSGVVLFRTAIVNFVAPIIRHATKYGPTSAITMLDALVNRSIIENAFIEFYSYVGIAHKTWSDADIKIRLPRVKRGAPPVPPSMIAVTPADSGFGAGFFNAAWLQRLKNLVYGTVAASRVTSITNTLKRKLRAVLGRAVKEEVRPSAIANRIQSELGGKFSEARAKLIARTETTRIANLAAKQAALETGIALDKIWIDTRDTRVRDSHWNIPDPIPAEEKFKIGDALMDIPGDPDGGAEEVCNCRCCVAYIPKGSYNDNFPQY